MISVGVSLAFKMLMVNVCWKIPPLPSFAATLMLWLDAASKSKDVLVYKLSLLITKLVLPLLPAPRTKAKVCVALASGSLADNLPIKVFVTRFSLTLVLVKLMAVGASLLSVTVNNNC